MMAQRFRIISHLVAVTAVMCSLLSSSAAARCDGPYPRVPSLLQTSEVPAEIVEDIFDLVNGLAAQRLIMVSIPS